MMNTKESYRDEGIYFRARHRVERVRKYYTHLIIFLVVNIIISTGKVIRNLNNGETFEEAFFDFNTFSVWIVWGLIIIIHTIAVFGFPLILGKNWEERKLKQFMDEDQSKDWKQNI
ncbi:2TM domain-containing protein [Winogradskyella sp. 3972H.M.0a.05]|uniref:2TM domain-containing protein n=1 Tax=Winogradskyella sp. 3972H.M.0a.05 TaxID=2950277 RepID=UPI003394CF1F